MCMRIPYQQAIFGKASIIARAVGDMNWSCWKREVRPIFGHLVAFRIQLGDS
jgi:hypothetical protein